MAPGLNGRQTGAVPKNRPRNNGAQSHRSFREALIQSSSLEWEPVLDQNSRSRSHRKISSTHSETEADSIRYDLASSLSSTMTSQTRFEDNFNEGGNPEMHGRLRGNIPDKKQVINKITQIQDYIQQTATLMNALKSSDSPDKKKECEKLSVIINDLKDSESKLLETLKNFDSVDSSRESLVPEANQGDNNNSDNNEEELIRRTEESKKKLELLQRRKQELIELQEKAKKQLQDAQIEQTRLVARASSLNQDINSNRFLDLNVQQLSQRLKTAQQLYKTSNQINATLGDGEEPEHPDEDQIEMSDTETDFQAVSDKVAELNMMKAQLAQIQKLMTNISLDPNGKDGTSTPTEMTEDRRDQGAQQRTSRNESVDEGANNAMKMEQAKLKLNQLTQLLEIAQSAQGAKGLPPGFLQMATSIANEDGASVRRTPSPCHSGKSQQRSGEEAAYMETVQLMTRELEERTAAMKEEHDKLVAARQELENLARKIPLVKDRGSLSPDDSGSEAPCLTNITLDSNGRLVNSTIPSEQQSPYAERPPYASRSGHSKTRQRAVWNAYPPSSSQEKKCKNEEMSRGQMNGVQNGSVRDQSRWSPSPTVSFCDNGSCSAIQTQNHLEKSGNICGRMVTDLIQRPARPEEISVEELYAQHQMLTRTVAQCSHLLWLQQKQIIELRNTLMLQQSAMFQNSLPQPQYPNQPPRNTPLPPSPFQFNPMPYPPQMPLHQEQNYLSPNQSVKLNSSGMPNIQTGQDFTDQYYLQGGQASLPSFTDVLDYQFRFGNCNRSNPQQVNSNSNVNQNLNQSGLNNRIPVAGMSCLGPEDSGALNNQVPPGNRANNYWDNFRSYSRQNLLSHSKSNEDTDSARRTSTTTNQERPLRETSSSITVQNNAPAGPSHESGPLSAYHAVDVSDYDGCQSPTGQTASASRPQSSRSRSADAHNHRKNESRNQENDSRLLNPKNESTTRARNPEAGSENIRSVRNDVGQPGRSSDNRNFVQLVRDLDNDEGRSGINKRRVDKSRSRNEGRGNLNNRSNAALPVVLRDNVYSEVTNFIRANESRPHFLIQLFRDLQQVTTDPLRQRTLESIQETVSVNNLTERSNINGANLNIIDNRNNIRENRSNLNRNQGEEQSIDSIVCQIRENQNTIRQNIGGSSGLACGGNNLENPNISNIRNLGNSRNNLESEGLRDLRTYFEANLCNFGHNSALENPNLSNIRENLTRRVTAGSDLDNTNPKNLYLSMYDNAWRRNQESNSGPEFMSPFHNCRNSEQFGNDYTQNGCRGNNGQCFCNNQLPLSLDTRGDGNFCENRQDPSPRCPVVDRDNRLVNVTREAISNGEDSEADNNFNSDARKRGYMDGSCDITHPGKKNGESRLNAAAAVFGLPSAVSGSDDESGEEQGAVALMPADWDRETSENRAYMTPVNAARNELPSLVDQFYDNSNCTCSVLPQLDDGDLAEADQSRNEETADASGGFTNQQIVDIGDEKCPASNSQPEEASFCLVPERRPEMAGESDMRGAESEGSCLYDNSTSESDGMYLRLGDNNDCQLRRNMSL